MIYNLYQAINTLETYRFDRNTWYVHDDLRGRDLFLISPDICQKHRPEGSIRQPR